MCCLLLEAVLVVKRDSSLHLADNLECVEGFGKWPAKNVEFLVILIKTLEKKENKLGVRHEFLFCPLKINISIIEKKVRNEKKWLENTENNSLNTKKLDKDIFKGKIGLPWKYVKEMMNRIKLMKDGECRGEKTELGNRLGDL